MANLGKKAKEKLNEWVHENINMPASKAGYPDAGAALSAAISAGGEVLIPEDLSDIALAVVPGGKLLKHGKKGLKGISLDYKKIADAEKDIARKKRVLSDMKAPTIKYGKGDPKVVKPDYTDVELREMEKLQKELKDQTKKR